MYRRHRRGAAGGAARPDRGGARRDVAGDVRAEGELARRLNDFDRAALARERRLLEARLGPGLAAAAGELAERDRLLEVMRTRLHGGELRFHPPDGFVLGDRWLSSLEQYTTFDRPGGPLLFDTDLRAVARADEKLRAGPTAQLLAAAVDVMAAATEAHEARHALDEVDPNGPPPPTPLFEVMERSTTQFIGLADAELRAYLGELHDTGSTACWVLAKMMRGVYGWGASRTPHFYATFTILRQLDPSWTARRPRGCRCCAICPTRSCAGASRPRGGSCTARRCCPDSGQRRRRGRRLRQPLRRFAGRGLGLAARRRSNAIAAGTNSVGAPAWQPP